jgi:carboxy-cis,cis-muconate cyclase
MRPSTTLFAFLSLLSAVNGELHQLIVGTFGTEHLYTLEFDDSALTLELIGNFTTNAASSWIALSVSISNTLSF